jgi:hypothetical protein
MLFSILLLTAYADPEEDKELYRSLIQCAAFHKIEAEKSRDNKDAQNALAMDFLRVAEEKVPNRNVLAAEADVDAMAKEYQAIMTKGDPEDIARGWTSLESACRDLYRVKDGLLGRAVTQEESR